MTTHDLIKRVRTEPENIEFSQVIDVIHHDYQYTASAFSNGALNNKAGSNEGSCKIFYFAQLNRLTETETLALFGKFYRQDVMQHPDGTDHGNIRNFMATGWQGIKFDASALIALNTD